MTNKEINEYLAEWLFGLQRDRWGNLIDRNNSGILEIDENGVWRIRDYCNNAMLVLEKLLPQGSGKIIEINSMLPSENFISVCYMGYFGRGNTIHEAICRCAVEYLKSLEEV